MIEFSADISVLFILLECFAFRAHCDRCWGGPINWHLHVYYLHGKCAAPRTNTCRLFQRASCASACQQGKWRVEHATHTRTHTHTAQTLVSDAAESALFTWEGVLCVAGRVAVLHLHASALTLAARICISVSTHEYSPTCMCVCISVYVGRRLANP